MTERFFHFALLASVAAYPSIALAVPPDIVTISGDRLGGTRSDGVEDALHDAAGLQQFRCSDARSANATNQGATLRELVGNASSRALPVLDWVP